jgi:tRNA threonylcarbamoyladenosine biosynthesis protein TsaB
MNEAYCAVYRNDEDMTELRPAALERPESLAGIAREWRVSAVAGEALSVFPEAWTIDRTVRRVPLARASAAVIARLARGDLARGRAVRAADAAPLYVRDRVALTIDERRAGVTA